MIKGRSGPSKFRRQLLFTIVTIFWFSQYIFIPYQTTYLSKIGVNPSFVGIIIGAYGFLQLLLRMPIGIMADRNGQHKKLIIFGVISAFIASLFRVFLPNGWGFFAGNIFSGLASTIWICFLVLFFSYFSNDRLQKASGIIITANNLGILISFITGTLLYDIVGMRLLCLLSAIAAFIAAALSSKIEDSKKTPDKPSVRELLKVFTDKRLIVFSLLVLIQQGVQISTAMSFTTRVAQDLGANGVQIGICSVIYILVAVLSSYFASSKIAQRHGGSLWIPVSFVLLALYCFVIPNLNSVYWIYLAQILCGLASGILLSLCISEAMLNIPEGKKSTAMGIYQAFVALGMTLFPILTGKIIDLFNIHAAFYCLASITVIGFVGAVMFYKSSTIFSARMKKKCAKQESD